jgi:hypothetical protein
MTVIYPIIDVNQEDWIADLEHEDRNTAEFSNVFYTRGYKKN